MKAWDCKPDVVLRKIATKNVDKSWVGYLFDHANVFAAQLDIAGPISAFKGRMDILKNMENRIDPEVILFPIPSLIGIYGIAGLPRFGPLPRPLGNRSRRCSTSCIPAVVSRRAGEGSY